MQMRKTEDLWQKAVLCDKLHILAVKLQEKQMQIYCRFIFFYYLCTQVITYHN